MNGIFSKLLTFFIEQIITKLISYVYFLLEKAKLKKVRTKEQLAAKDHYNNVLKNPASTEQERADAYKDLINSGH